MAGFSGLFAGCRTAANTLKLSYTQSNNSNKYHTLNEYRETQDLVIPILVFD